MSKHELVTAIRQLNPTATEAFLGNFAEADLVAYLRQLQELNRPTLPRSSTVFRQPSGSGRMTTGQYA